MDEKILNSLLNESKMQTVLMTDICSLMTTFLTISATRMALSEKSTPEDAMLYQSIQQLISQTTVKMDKIIKVRNGKDEIELEYEQKLGILQKSRAEHLRKLT